MVMHFKNKDNKEKGIVTNIVDGMFGSLTKGLVAGALVLVVVIALLLYLVY